MFITVKTQELADNLRNTVSVIESRQGMPVLSNILLSIEGGHLKLTGSDLDVEIRSTQTIDSSETIKTTLNGRKLFDIIKSFEASEEVKLTFEENKTIISSGRSRFVLTAINPEEFPLMGEEPDLKTNQIESKKLHDLFTQTFFSMATQDARQYLNGLYLQANENKLTAVATDGHRLAVADETTSNPIDGFSAIIPRKCILEIKRILMNFKDNKEKLIDFSCNNKKIIFKIGPYVIISKLIEGNYPEYKKVFPEKLPNKLTVDRKELKTSLQKMAILSNEQYRGVKLILNKNELKLAAHNPAQEEGEDLVSCEYTGDQFEVGFNVSYLVEVLETLTTEKININFNNSDTGCLITNNNNEGSPQYIIMPMRV